ncbi:MAG TPA: glycosyltransferase [Thermoanaerobaculia bacterium]|nr:glycosyltransferase [Thermoanaerobaculia bacterium]
MRRRFPRVGQAARELYRRVRGRIWRILGLGPHHRVVYDANRAGERRLDKRALLVYLPRAFLIPDDDPAFLRHSNLRCCQIMAAELGELGYIVDVVNPRHISFRPRYDYDLVLGERRDWGRTERRFRKDAVRVFLATTMNHIVHNENIRRRHERLVARGRPPVSLRRVYSEELPAVWASHALVGVGNSFSLDTWRRGFAGPLYSFDNCGLRAGVLAEESRDFESARRHFLFFASGSQMQKGLDLLLEVFSRHPELDLYVCSRFESEPDFCDCYRQELFETPNIHALGWTAVESPRFFELLRRCAFVVYPTCSEGQAGSVVHCMHSGLIPLVTRETGIDTDGFGVNFADDSLEEIERGVVEASEQPVDWLRERTEATRSVARTRYTEEAFRRRWRAILEEILPA